MSPDLFPSDWCWDSSLQTLDAHQVWGSVEIKPLCSSLNSILGLARGWSKSYSWRTLSPFIACKVSQGEKLSWTQLHCKCWRSGRINPPFHPKPSEPKGKCLNVHVFVLGFIISLLVTYLHILGMHNWNQGLVLTAEPAGTKPSLKFSPF